MRFSLRRRATPDGSAAPRVGDAAHAPAAGASAVAVATRPAIVHRDWEALPAMPLTVTRASLTARPNDFAKGLVSRRDIATSHLFVHRRQVDAPAGSVAVDVVPVEPQVLSSSTAEGPGSPLPRIDPRRVRPASQVAAPRADILAVAVAPEPEEPTPVDPAPTAGEQPLGGFETIIDAAIRAAGGDPWGRPPALPPIEPPPPPRPVGPRYSLAESRRMGLGPAYHGSLPEAMQNERDHREPMPSGVRDVIQQTLGVDVGEKMVHRGPLVSAEAQAMGARAYTRDREVFVADDVGALDSAEARATVAHEMTHVAQQIRSTIVPDEHTPEGIVHEAEAQAVEQFVRGDADAVRPDLLHATRRDAAADDAGEAASEATATMRDLVARGVARWDGRGGIELIPPSERGAGSAGTQRQTATAPPARPTSPSGGGSATGGTHAQQGYTTNYGVGGFFHDLGNQVADEALGTIGSVFGFSDSFMDEQRREMAHEDRDWLSNNYRETRLEHRQQRRLTQLNDERSFHHQQPLGALTAEDLQQITAQVNEDVTSRLNLLNEEERKANEKLNENRQANQPEQHVERDKLERAYHTVFDNPDSDDMPTAAQIAGLLGAAAAATAQQRPGTQTPTSTPSASAGAARGAAAGTTTPQGTTPAATTSTTPTGTTPTGARPTSTTPTGTPPAGAGAAPAGAAATTTGAAATGTASGQAAGATTEPTDWAGQHRADAQRATAEQHQWEDQNLTVGQRFKTLGAAAGYDLLGGILDTEASMFGFSSDFHREVVGDVERDRRQTMEGIRHPDQAGTAGAAAGAAAGTTAPATTPAAGGAAAGEHHDAAHPAAGGAPAHDTHAIATAAAHAAAASHTDEHGHPRERLSPTGEPMVEVTRLDMEQLAERLYPNIRSRLRQELLIDRERAGLLTDFR